MAAMVYASVEGLLHCASKQECGDMLGMLMASSFDLMHRLEGDGYVQGWMEHAILDLQPTQIAANAGRPA